MTLFKTIKHITFIFLFIGIIAGCNSKKSDLETKNAPEKEEFEGIITYLITAESKIPDISTELLQSLYGDTMKFYFKNGNYRMTYNGKEIKDIYYLKSTNKEYDVLHTSDSMLVTPYSVEERPLKSSISQDEPVKIMNRECKGLINDLGDTKNFYWYDNSIYINPDHFKKCKFSYINTYYQKAQSPWLKYKYEGTSFNLTFTACNLEKKKLDDKIFELPALPEATN